MIKKLFHREKKVIVVENPPNSKKPERLHDFTYMDADLAKRLIRFYATPDLEKLFESFGDVVATDVKDRYFILVDWRYDIQQVIEYARYLSSLPCQVEETYQFVGDGAELN